MDSKRVRNPHRVARAVFARNLRRLRLAAGLSQEAFADLCGLHRNYVGSVERGERNVSIDNMESIALALNQPLAVMVTDHEGSGRVSR
jgi:transcriptional regulator with XRE-family HTH domain